MSTRPHSSIPTTIASSSVGSLNRGFSFTLGLPRAELVQDLLQRAQDRELALRLVHLQPFQPGFKVV